MPTATRTIPEELAGMRLDQALAKMFPDYSRSRLTAWLKSGAIRVDGASPKPREKIAGGEKIVLDVELEDREAAAPEPMPLDVVYEDEEVLVINKPAGLVVHPGAGNVSGTLMNGLLAHAAGLAALPRAGIIHRIDKLTTGLLVVGKTLEAHTALTRALADHDIRRQYVAVVTGVLTGGGRIAAPIGRHPVDRTRMAVRDSGKPAVTHYTVRERYAAHTTVDVTLETGRTHQIRVHFAYRRHPLVGDPVYGGRLSLPKGASEDVIAALRGFRRQALHAARLEFQHPSSGKTVVAEAALPDDMESLMAVLSQAGAGKSARV
jgi:23S rRNA pseudouridine1911/1915/1917 synthase